MPGTIQSVERAARLLRALADAAGPQSLGDLAVLLELPKPTVHGLVRTLVGSGLVSQDVVTRRYAVLPDALGSSGVPDPHWLRSRAMNWTDRLAARTGEAVEVGVVGLGPDGEPAMEVAHHVFRPDGSAQHLSTGEHQPLHATALGLVLLAQAPSAPAVRSLRLVAYTSATPRDADALAAHLHAVRRARHAVEVGTHRPDRAAVAVGVRGTGGTTVAAIAVVGRPEHLLDGARHPRAALLGHLDDAAQAVTAAIEDQG